MFAAREQRAARPLLGRLHRDPSPSFASDEAKIVERACQACFAIIWSLCLSASAQAACVTSAPGLEVLSESGLELQQIFASSILHLCKLCTRCARQADHHRPSRYCHLKESTMALMFDDRTNTRQYENTQSAQKHACTRILTNHRPPGRS